MLLFSCLNRNDVITAQVSDHQPLIHNGGLFWNIMMQGKKRASGDYNNGFGIEETDSEYMKRLMRVSHVIAEIIFRHPEIEIIGLCEGPNKIEHLSHFSHMLKSLTTKFSIKNLEHSQPWGMYVLTLKTSLVSVCEVSVEPSLENRFQLLKVNTNREEKYFALGHFPFRGDENIQNRHELSLQGKRYCEFTHNLLTQHADSSFMFFADFNFNPYLISTPEERALDFVSNNSSQLLKINPSASCRKVETVTVDGILLSKREKQKQGYTLSSSRFFRIRCTQNSDETKREKLESCSKTSSKFEQKQALVPSI